MHRRARFNLGGNDLEIIAREHYLADSRNAPRPDETGLSRLMRQTISDMNGPFSLSDVLERVIPGLLLILATHLVFFPMRGPDDYQANAAIIGSVVVLVAYPLGVGLNFLGNLVRWSNARSKVDPVNQYADCKEAFAFLRLPINNDLWRYCYGIVAKHGYSANVDLFAKLEIFSRSVMAGSLIVSIEILVAMQAFGKWTDWHHWASLAIAVISALTFLFAARRYGQSFIKSIYEAFYSWYIDDKAQATPNQNQPE